MMTKHELESNVGDVLAEADNTDDRIQQFTLIWQGTVRPALSLVKLITGPKVDEKIDKLIASADGVAEGNAADGKFCMVYDTFQIRQLLKAIQIFTGPKVDKAINKFIDLSESICTENEPQV